MRSQVAMMFALVLLAGGAVVYFRSESDEARRARNETQRRLDQLAAELKRVESDLAEIRREAVSAESLIELKQAAGKGDIAIAIDEERISSALSRLEEVETRLHEAETRRTQLGSIPILQTLMRTDRWKHGDPEYIAEQQDLLVDVTRPDEERLAALRALRGQPRELNPHSADVARSLVRWMQETGSPATRADIIRNLHRSFAPELKEPLLAYLSDDPDPGVREEAAETLEDFLDDPRVREALARARDEDDSVKVRRQAEETLEEAEDR